MLDLAFDLLLWLFAIALGVAFGAGLYEARIVMPDWPRQAPWLWVDPERRFWAWITTGPLTVLTVLALAAAVAHGGPPAPWLLVAAAVSLAERVATFTYFRPTMARLRGGAAVPAGPDALALARWLRLDGVRSTAVLVAWLAALRALSLSGQPVAG